MVQYVAARVRVAAIAAADGVLDALLFLLWLISVAVLVPTGLALTLVAGLGLPVLAFAVLGTTWYLRLEVRRTAVVFQLDLLAPPRPRTERRGWRRPLAQAWLDLHQRAWWRMLAHLVITGIMGWVVAFALAYLIGGGLVELFGGFLPLAAERADSNLPWWLPQDSGMLAVAAGAAMLVVAVGLLVGMHNAQRWLSLLLLRPPADDSLRQELKETAVQRDQAVRTVDSDRRRIERDLHDGVQPQLVTVGMMLSLAQAKLDTDPEAARSLLAEAHAGTKTAIADLRQIGRGIHPAILTESGLDAALSALVAQFALPVRLEVQLPNRSRPEIEGAAYFTVAEALSNAAKYSSGTMAIVRLREFHRDGRRQLWLQVVDDGHGGAVVHPHGGLAGLQERVAAVGGRLTIDSTPLGTALTAVLPCE